MAESVTSLDSPSTLVSSASDTERDTHRKLLFDHIEFLLDTLTAAHTRRQREPPVGCPRATPEWLARKSKKKGESCRYAVLERDHGANEEKPCPCADPLCGSEDPLDAVAAVVLSDPVEAPSERFFQRRSRRTVSTLREQYGSWEDIASMDHDTLSTVFEKISSRKEFGSQRVARLERLLTAVEETHYTDGVTLREFSRVPYSRYVEFLSTVPGIDETDAWWTVQTAFDKPVWPVDPRVDKLLCSLGLIDPDDLQRTEGRRGELENEFLDRLIAPLYRAVSTHAVVAGVDECGEECEIRKFLLTHRIRQQSAKQSGPTTVDLFAGAGGLSSGLKQAGYDVRWAIDIDSDAVATYRLNHPEIPYQNVVCDDIREIDLTRRIREATGEPDLIVGGPPCQSLSQAGYRSRRADDEEYSILEDDRTTLYSQYVNAVDELRPKVIVMENVEGMVNEVGDTGVRIIDWVLKDLEGIGENGPGYDVEFQIQNMADLGVPQNRERVLLVGIREDVVDDTTPRTLLDQLSVTESPQTIQHGLSGLPRLCRGEGGRLLAKRPRGSKSDYVKEHCLDTATNLCFNHRAREHPMKKDRILFDEALSPGQTGWDVKYGSDGEYAEYIEYDVGTADSQRFGDKYRMLEWSEPAPTIVAHLAKDANGYVLPDYYKHARPDEARADPERNRGLTPREAARLQSFSDDYIFLGAFTSWFRQIGNAVPPVAGKRIGNVLKPILTEDSEPKVGVNELTPDEVVSDD